MKTSPFLIIFFSAAVLLSVNPSPSFAVSTLAIAPAGDSAFVLQGTGFEGAAAIEITITYDAASLVNPRINEGPLVSGAMTAVNPNAPGTIRMAIVTTHPVTGSGTLATLTFDRVGNSIGKIISLNAKLANINGQSLPVQGQIINTEPAPAIASTREQDRAGTAASPPGVSSDAGTRLQPMISGGIVIVPETARGQQEKKAADPSEQEKAEQPAEAIPADGGVTVARTNERGADGPAAQTRKIYQHKSVLDRFHQYKGDGAAKKFLSFFEQEAPIGFRQEPAIGLSNGTTTVKLTFISVPGDRTASEAALLGARLISMERDPDYTNTWIVKAVPAKGEYSASMSISQGKVVTLYPMTIAPDVNIDLDKSGTVTESDFDLFLKERGSPKAPRFDLNGDGKRDYIDDYIFTANYLVKNQSRAAKK